MKKTILVIGKNDGRIFHCSNEYSIKEFFDAVKKRDEKVRNMKLDDFDDEYFYPSMKYENGCWKKYERGLSERDYYSDNPEIRNINETEVVIRTADYEVSDILWEEYPYGFSDDMFGISNNQTGIVGRRISNILEYGCNKMVNDILSKLIASL